MAEGRRQTYQRMLYMLRREAGYTQEQLAALIDESPQTISKIELGKMVPSFDTLFKIADFFHTTVDAMTGGTAPRQGPTTYIDAEFSASDGSMLFIGTQDFDALGKAVNCLCGCGTKTRRGAPAPAPASAVGRRGGLGWSRLGAAAARGRRFRRAGPAYSDGYLLAIEGNGSTPTLISLTPRWMSHSMMPRTRVLRIYRISIRKSSGETRR